MESINPNDIFNLDINNISLITLKNGDMIIIDNTVPEKGGNKKNKQKSRNTNVSNNIKNSAKLEISSSLNFSFKGKTNQNKYKNDFNAVSEIIRNINLYFEGIKKDINDINKIKQYAKKQNLNLENEKNMVINTYNYRNNDKVFSFRPSITENDNSQNKNIKGISKVENYNFINQKENNDFSKNLSNISKIINNTSNITQNNTMARKVNVSRMNTKFLGGLRKNRNSVNVVCSLSIGGYMPEKINLVNQFNDIVDRLNNLREKNIKTRNDEKKYNRNKSLRYYQFYKHKKSINNIKKNIKIFNTNNNVRDIHKDKIEKEYLKTYSNSTQKTKISFTNLNNYNSNDNKIINKTYGRSFTNLPIQGYKNFKVKINKYTSNIILPCNKM